MVLEFTYEDLVRTFGRLLSGPPEDGDIIIPKVAADHLGKHGVAPGDFFRAGMESLDDNTPTGFSHGMTFRIHPIIRRGHGFWGRLWRSIHTLPDDWMIKEKAVAWFVQHMAFIDHPSPGLELPAPVWHERDRMARERTADLRALYESLFDVVVVGPVVELLEG